MSAPLSVEQLVELFTRGGNAPDLRGDDYVARCPIGGGEVTISPNGATAPDGGRVVADVIDTCGHELLELTGALKLTAAGRAAKDHWQILGDLLGLSVVGATNYGGGEAYDLHLFDGRRVELGGAHNMLDRRRFEAAVIRGAKNLKVDLSAKDHRAAVAIIARYAEDRELDTADDEIAGWLGDFTRRLTVVDMANRKRLAEQLQSRESFIDQATRRLYLRLGDLALYVNRMTGSRTTERELGVRLARQGFTRPDDGGQITLRPGPGQDPLKVRYWASPEERLATSPQAGVDGVSAEPAPIYVCDLTPGGDSGDTDTPDRSGEFGTPDLGDSADTPDTKTTTTAVGGPERPGPERPAAGGLGPAGRDGAAGHGGSPGGAR